MELWYTQPADAWTKALAIGNGRIGGMVFGGIERERIALNEDTLWSGYPRDTTPANTWERVLEAQRLMESDDFFAAQAHIEKHALGSYTQAYEPLGDLWLDFPSLVGKPITQYRRNLSLDDATASVCFTVEGVCYRRTCFVSAADQALVMRISADKPNANDLDISMKSPLRHSVFAQGATLETTVRCPSYCAPNYKQCDDPVRYEEPSIEALAAVHVYAAQGSVFAANGKISIRGANHITLILCCRTSFCGYDRHPGAEPAPYRQQCLADLNAIRTTPYETLLARHLDDYRPLFHRVHLRLAGGDRFDLPMDERLRRFTEATDDEGLLLLLFQFGRYLLIACSRPGAQAANLQGIWNQDVRPPWSSNYTVNINTQMNYWPAEVCNLSEMHEPLFDLIDRLGVAGANTAKNVFNARGATCAHNTDLWGHSAPVGEGGAGAAVYGWWPMGYGWLIAHLFERYIFTGDRAFLRQRVLPAYRKAAQFFLDACHMNPLGYCSLYPATSPENNYLLHGKPMPIAYATAMDTAIITEVFQNYLYALEVLGLEEEDAPAVREMLTKLQPFSAGADGRLIEWDETKEEAEPDHRHISHLYGLHPGHLIAPDTTPELAQACRISLEHRGDEGTGWSLAWKVNVWARLGNGNRALKIARRQLRLVEAEGSEYTGGGTYANLFDAHPPFQIDGNFGIASGIAQMFVQVRLDTILLLPALPDAWQEGSVVGLRGA
ncbi:MAG: glycoside hydrolase family 95 protein, partial [Clostridia bacterium]|nr:glycoside hydrolase family 95 protein [Clostridia bacterium]